MSKKIKQKYYVVWEGVRPGVYNSWTDCQLQIKGYVGAIYKSFDAKDDAEKAFSESPSDYIGQSSKNATMTNENGISPYIRESLAVDAACSGNPGKMEYRGVYVSTGQQVFHVGPMAQGTNNIGEFLALVHGLALFNKNGCNLPIYSDSQNAILWVQQKKCKTKLERTEINRPIFDLIARAEKWLRENTYTTQILKWETGKWGEIPADFGRK
ncbi:MAG: ribonuclease H family protein [Prevotellaceae bacterium]|jgi:ribonuclease HI|nr:ribonuclease H family protein [Prevotellaceae bacterium]